MPVVPLKEIVDRAFNERYGVPAINIFNDLTLEAVLAGAVEARSPLIVQTSVKTVKSIGSRRAVRHVDVDDRRHRGARHAAPRPLPGAGRDHRVPGARLELGALRRLHSAGGGEPAADRRGGRGGPRGYGAQVEGEIESITGVEDGIGSDTEAARQSLEVALDVHRDDRGRCVRTVDRQRPRRRTRRRRCSTSSASPTSSRRTGVPDRAARRQRADRRAVPRPDRPRLRQGQHLDGAQDDVHEVEPRRS